jgi:Icc-related predicted phosphoesterase
MVGHIHAAAGMDRLGNTVIGNPGMLRRGGWLEVIIEKSRLHIALHDSF